MKHQFSKLLVLYLLSISAQSNATHQLVELTHEEKPLSPKWKLNQATVDYLFARTRDIILQQKSGLQPEPYIIGSETGTVKLNKDNVITFSVEHNDLNVLPVALQFHDIHINGLAIKEITYQAAVLIEDVNITHIEFIVPDAGRVNLYNADDELTILFEHKNYNYRLIQTTTLRVKRRKSFGAF